MERRSDMAGSQASTVFAFVASAIKRSGSPGRGDSICTGISLPVISRAHWMTSRTE